MSKAPEQIDFTPLDATDVNAERLIGGFVERASEMHASDLFFSSMENAIEVAVRHLGVMMPMDILSVQDGRRLINYIKAMSGIDMAERRRPLDGRWIYAKADGRKVDLRINTIPTLYGEDVTLRLLERDATLHDLQHIGAFRSQLNELVAMLNSPGGLILVTGPTGAGKTTTLYACLHYLNNGKRKINTIEDPIEYAVDGIHQSQVHLSIGLDFPDLLRSVLRQAPDVIMVGEIRDKITAQTAIRAANSGHLVFATLHAPVAAAAVQSMLSYEVHPHFLSTCLRGLITQRLVRTMCDECRIAIDVQEAPLAFHDVRPWLEPGQGDRIYSAVGCKACHHTGYTGRTGVFEVLPITPSIRRLVANAASARDIEQQAMNEGMIEFRRAGLIKVAQGITSCEEILRVVPAEHLGIEA